jgi:hypothetical protein
MGFLDRVKELATDGLEKGQELAKTQQLKLELKKLEAAVEDAHAAYGKKAFEHAEAGTLSADALGTEAQAIRDAKAAADAKKAEIEALGPEAADDDAEPVAAGDGASTSS